MISAAALAGCVVVAFALGVIVGMMLCQMDRDDRRRSSGPPKGTGGSSEGWKA